MWDISQKKVWLMLNTEDCLCVKNITTIAQCALIYPDLEITQLLHHLLLRI